MIRTHLARALLLVCVMQALLFISIRLEAQTGCSPNPTPFTDLGTMSSVFCQAVATAYFSGLTNGTTATTYSPTLNVPREQMAAFTTRTLEQSLKRGNRRAALGQWATPRDIDNMGSTPVPDHLNRVQSDGADLWASTDSSLVRIRASDGKVLTVYTGLVGQGRGVLVTAGRVFVAGHTSTFPGRLYSVDPRSDTQSVTEHTTTSPLPLLLDGLATDGERIWVGSQLGAIALIPHFGSDTIVRTGYIQPRNLIYDGTHMWVSDFGTDKVYKLNPAQDGAILQTITVGSNPLTMAFDGTNLWVPNYGSNSVSVVRVKDAAGNALAAPFVLATLTGNGLETPSAVAFDGERMLVTNENAQTVSLFRAADLAPLASTAVRFSPVGACSDGLNFWIATSVGLLLRY